MKLATTITSRYGLHAMLGLDICISLSVTFPTTPFSAYTAAADAANEESNEVKGSSEDGHVLPHLRLGASVLVLSVDVGIGGLGER